MRKLLFAVIALMLFSSVSSAKDVTRLRGFSLKSGDCIGVLSPGTYTSSRDFEGSIELLKSQGYRIKLAPSATAMYEHFAGTDRKRAEDINAFFRDDSVKAILCVRISLFG